MTKIRKHRTNILFPKTSFISGVGSSFNVFGNYYKFNTSKTSQESDFKAIESDWGVVGQDIQKAIKELKKQLSLK